MLVITIPSLARTGRATQWRIPIGAACGPACFDWLRSVPPGTRVHLDNIMGSGQDLWTTAGECLANLAPCPSTVPILN
jgi:hypothetical protein